MGNGIVWQAVVVDDCQAEEVQELIEGNAVVDEPDSLAVTTFESFDDASLELEGRRFDVVILDLKDDSPDLPEDETMKGQEVFERIRATRFAPVVFYTAYPKRVEATETPFLRIVERGDITGLLDSLRSLMQTNLPQLSRHIEQQQRAYMWDFLEQHWSDVNDLGIASELTYLLARRLAYSLQRSSIREFLAETGASMPAPDSTSHIHPIEMYIMPSMHPKLLAGDILNRTSDDSDLAGLWIVLTPSCDLEQGNAERVLLARCIDLKAQPEYGKFAKCLSERREISNSAKDELHPLVTNNRKKGQRARYYFLPGVLDVPDSVVDLQDLLHVPVESVSTEDRIASLDSPFAESLLQRFAAYFGRLGTPDVDARLVFERLERTGKAE